MARVYCLVWGTCLPGDTQIGGKWLGQGHPGAQFLVWRIWWHTLDFGSGLPRRQYRSAAKVSIHAVRLVLKQWASHADCSVSQPGERPSTALRAFYSTQVQQWIATDAIVDHYRKLHSSCLGILRGQHWHISTIVQFRGAKSKDYFGVFWVHPSNRKNCCLYCLYWKGSHGKL